MKRLLAVTCCLFLLPFATVLQAGDDLIDIDAMSVPELRGEIEKIEKEIYRVFNARTEDESLHISCNRYTPTGSHRSRETCEPKFLIAARAANAKGYQDGTDGLLGPEGLVAETSTDFDRFNAAMEALTEEYDYFRELNIILGVLRQRMDELR